MWVLKLKLDSDKQFVGKLAIKHQVSIIGYIFSYYRDNKFLYIIATGLLFGDEKNKKELVKDAKKQPDCLNIEANNDFIIATLKQPLFTEPVYDPRIIRPKPIVINCKEKKHTWELASFEKEILTKVLKFSRKYLGGRLIKLTQEKLSNISVTRALPDLTKKQKKALELAVSNGYYDYPKKIKLEKLAEIMDVSYSTFQQHLKTAEGKLLPAIFKEL